MFWPAGRNFKKSALTIRREGSTLPILGQPNGHAELALRQTPLGCPCMKVLDLQCPFAPINSIQFHPSKRSGDAGLLMAYAFWVFLAWNLFCLTYQCRIENQYDAQPTQAHHSAV